MVANYRHVVLTAFKSRISSRPNGCWRRMDAEKAVLESARHTLDIANNRYQAGLVTYLEVATGARPGTVRRKVPSSSSRASIALR